MNDRHEDSTLSTADMVAAANGDKKNPAASEQMQPGAGPSERPATGMAATSATTAAVADRNGNGSTASTSPHEEAGSLFAGQENESFRKRWEEVQTGFVDDPRQAVEQADHLVAEVMKRLAELFAEER